MERFKLNYFPDRFDFFHLGSLESVTPQKKEIETSIPPFIVLFKISGDLRALAAVAFEQKPSEEQESLAVELSNILVGKFIHQLSNSTGDRLDLSPPELLLAEHSRYRHVLSTVKNQIQQKKATRHYRYEHESVSFDLSLIYLPSQQGES